MTGDTNNDIGDGINVSSTGTGTVAVTTTGAVSGGVNGVTIATDGAATVNANSVTGGTGDGISVTAAGATTTVAATGHVESGDDGISVNYMGTDKAVVTANAVTGDTDASGEGNGIGVTTRRQTALAWTFLPRALSKARLACSSITPGRAL